MLGGDGGLQKVGSPDFTSGGAFDQFEAFLYLREVPL